MWNFVTSLLKTMGARNYRRSLLQSVCALGLVLLLHSGASSATIQAAKVTQLLDGNQVFIQNKPAKVNDLAQKGQRVRTGESRAELLFNTGAVGRLSPNSILTVGQCARLRQGVLLVNGAINGCTSSVVAGVRGTTYLMEVKESGEAEFTVLEGEVVVTRQAQPEEPEAIGEALPVSKSKQFGLPIPVPKPKPQSDPGSPAENQPPPESEPPARHDGTTAVVKEGEKITVSQKGALGAISRLTAQDFINILQGNLFTGFLNQIPGMSKVTNSFQRLFPGVPLPNLNLPVPRIPIPRPF